MKETILDAAAATVQEKGLKALSFQLLADDVGLSKASIFHYFKNKDAVINALIDRCQVQYIDHYDMVIRTDKSAPEKLEELGTIFYQSSQSNRLCMLAVLSTESTTMAPETRDHLKKAAKRTLGRFGKVFEQGRRERSLCFEGRPEDSAMAFLAMLQGLQILGRATQDPESIRHATRAAVQALRC